MSSKRLKRQVSSSEKEVKRDVVINKTPAYSLRSNTKSEENSLGTKAFPTPNILKRKRSDDGPRKKQKIEHHKAGEAESAKKADYHTPDLDDVALVSNVEKFECPICFLDVDVGEGVTLHECLHSFCKGCLAGAIQFSETAQVNCPYMKNQYSCESNLQEREVRALVTPEMYEIYLQRSVALAESQAQNSFHCKTPDCPGWCLEEGKDRRVRTFFCPACKQKNCLTCAAIHKGKNCLQYQDDQEFMSDSNKNVQKTRKYLQELMEKGKAMRCPGCKVHAVKISGCDHVECSLCYRAFIWVRKPKPRPKPRPQPRQRLPRREARTKY